MSSSLYSEVQGLPSIARRGGALGSTATAADDAVLTSEVFFGVDFNLCFRAAFCLSSSSMSATVTLYLDKMLALEARFAAISAPARKASSPCAHASNGFKDSFAPMRLTNS
jgi:hypothetical protein